MYAEALKDASSYLYVNEGLKVWIVDVWVSAALEGGGDRHENKNDIFLPASEWEAITAQRESLEKKGVLGKSCIEQALYMGFVRDVMDMRSVYSKLA